MNTLFLLMAEYGTVNIPLTDRCLKYFGLEEAKAKRQAAQKKLPVSCFKTGSQKSIWLISAVDLAEHIDHKREEARTIWDLLNS